jgi:hypothetical protein
MSSLTRNAAVAVGTVGEVARTGARLIGRLTGGAQHPREDPQRWLGVTVLRPPAEVPVEGPDVPEPLRRLGASVELRAQPAPGDRGTELYARPRTAGALDTAAAGAPDTAGSGAADQREARRALRTALREAKALLETGEVVRADAPATTHPGPAGRVLAALDRIGQGEGRL